MIRGLLCLFIFISAASAQETTPAFIKLVQPSKTSNAVKSSRQFIIGSTCKTCSLTINQKPVKVYATGAFAWEIALKPGDSSFLLRADDGVRPVTRTLVYSYTLPAPALPVSTLAIESIESFPEGNLVLAPGDQIKFRVKALPNAIVTAMQGLRLYELPITQTRGMAGIYQGSYTVKSTDSFFLAKFPISVKDSAGNMASRETKYNFSVMSPYTQDVAITKGRLAHLEYGLGDDRLGGAKVGYIDSSILLKLVGKVGSHYKVQLTKNRTAYIPEELVELMPKGSFTPESLTNKWNAYGDNGYDYVKIGLFARLPYQSFQLTDPSQIVVDIYGATNNTNWITQMESLQEVKKVDYEQVEDGLFRVTITLKHPQHWGHLVYYNGTTLVIKIKQQPKDLSLNHLTVAVDAGHGGTNSGAVGPTGVYEKEITLALSLLLQKALEKEGAKVIMTRSSEQFFDNKERILFYRDSLPDLLLSVHLNSSDDPIRTMGTSTYYRYIGFRNLSLSIYKRLLELGLKEYGNTGSFNFMLNSPTEYPNALIETLFLSNPEEEMKILDPSFQQELVDKIVEGVKDFLSAAAKN